MEAFLFILAIVLSIVLTSLVRGWINKRFEVVYFGLGGWIKHVFVTWAVCFGVLIFAFSMFFYGQ